MIDPKSRFRVLRNRFARAVTRGVGGAVICLLASPILAAQPAPPPFSRIVDVLALPIEQAARGLPVRVRGVVTWQGHGLNFTLQDESGGIYVSGNESVTAHVWQGDPAVLRSIHEGAEVEVEARSNQGGLAPNLYPVALRVLGTKPLPRAALMDWTSLLEGADCGRRVEVRAVVQGFQATDYGWTLQLGANPHAILADIARDVCPNPATLVDTEIRLCGVAMIRYNTRGEAITPRLITNLPQDILVEKPAPPAGAVPQVSLGKLQPYHSDPVGPHRVRVQGTVTFSLPKHFLYLQDGAHSVRVETKTQTPLQLGDHIEAAGFVDMTREIGMLRDATVRRLAGGSPPVATNISPEEIMAINQLAVVTGHMAQPHDYDGHLIRFRARLLAVQADPLSPQRRLLIERPGLLSNGINGLVIQANLQDGLTNGLDALQPGSEIEVTGLVQLVYGVQKNTSLRRAPAQLDLILRSAADVVVLNRPTWWTAQHLTAVLAAVLLVLGAAMVWSLQLRRQVRRKTSLLAREMRARKDASIEFQATLRERTRLATNLHDTVLQTIGGIGFQIQACEVESLATQDPDETPLPGYLKAARLMVDHAATEVRNSVWALRSLPLDGVDLSEALRTTARRLGVGHPARIDIRIDSDLSQVPDFIAGNLLLFVQEAVHNSLQHGHPHALMIEIRVLDHPARIVLTVGDDGDGFTPGTQAGVEQGHFGLQGMRERIERLNGCWRIDSSPGAGTTLHAEVPLRSYDDDMTGRPSPGLPNTP